MTRNNVMQIHVLYKITFFLGNKKIDTFHYTMFHGLAARAASSDPDKAYFLGDSFQNPLQLTLDMYRINLVIQPGTNLLVTKTVKDVFAQFKNVGFLPAEL